MLSNPDRTAQHARAVGRNPSGVRFGVASKRSVHVAHGVKVRFHGVKLRKRLRLINKNLQQFCNGLEWGGG
jgi:hypothetical protein